MPAKNYRRSPARVAATAASAKVAAAGLPNTGTPRPKSPGRSPKKSPGRRAEKSPARRTEKSPSRRTGRSPSRRADKSPARTAKSPPNRRKSPGRKPKSPVVKSTQEFKVVEEDIIKDQPMVILTNHERGDGFLMTSIRASRESSTASSIVLRRSTRVKDVQDKYEQTKGIEQLDVEDDIDLEYPEKPSKQESKPVREFGGVFGAMLLPIVAQVTLLAAHVYSSKAQYGIKDFKIPLTLKSYLDLEVVALYFGFVVLQLVLSIVPIGKLVDGLPGKLGKLQYRCNGLISTILTLAILGGLRHFKYPVTLLVDKYIQFYVTGIIFGYILALILYIKGGRAPLVSLNPYAVTGNRIYDFWMGREINPRVGPFDVKMGLLRISIIGVILVNGSFILKSLEQSSGYSPTLLVAAGMQIWYCLDTLWFEDSFLASFGVMYEGTGYMLTLGYNMYPFIPTLITRIIYNYRLEVPLYALAIIAVINTIGFVIYRGSNSQKSEFRKNPLNPALAHLETIPTSRGKKLLVSGWWGWVRHPNYLGDIIMHWAWASTCGLAHPLPYLVPLFTTILLLSRAKRDDIRCRQRYNAAWDRYSNRVKYHVVPKVF